MSDSDSTLAKEALYAALNENYDDLGNFIAAMTDRFARYLWIALREMQDMIEATDLGETDRPWDAA